jgi:hypothetical protein
MKLYSAFEWILIDIATQKGLDKCTFEERIQWTKDNIKDLEKFFSEEWKEKPLYIKAVMALRDVQKGKPTGHMVGVDASASGMQIMSALTGCIKGAEATGLINPDVRADVYTEATKVMNKVLHEHGLSVSVDRADMKRALMTSFYGSVKEPENLFGKDTVELQCFYEAAKELAPGAWELLNDLMSCWTQEKVHTWIAPDGFDVRVKVMQTKQTRIEVDELDHATFTYQYMENEATAKGRSLPANVTHSIDSLMVREMHRMVNYDPRVVKAALQELLNPTGNASKQWVTLYEKTGFATFRAIADIVYTGSIGLSEQHRKVLINKCEEVLKDKPYPLVTIHDDYKTLPSGVNRVRYFYKEIMAEIADAWILDYILSELLDSSIKYSKLGTIGSSIKNSNYALC